MKRKPIFIDDDVHVDWLHAAGWAGEQKRLKKARLARLRRKKAKAKKGARR